MLPRCWPCWSKRRNAGSSRLTRSVKAKYWEIAPFRAISTLSNGYQIPIVFSPIRHLAELCPRVADW